MVAILSKAESNIDEDERAKSTGQGFQPSAAEVPEIVAAIDEELERCKTQGRVNDLMGSVNTIATFTTVDEHRQYFRQVMYEVDQIDKRRVTYYQALCLHNDRLEKVKRQQAAREEMERRLKAYEEEQEAYRREALARMCLEL